MARNRCKHRDVGKLFPDNWVERIGMAWEWCRVCEATRLLEKRWTALDLSNGEFKASGFYWKPHPWRSPENARR